MAHLTYAAAMKKLFLVLLIVSCALAPAGAREKKKSLYQRLGGVYAISALVDDFIDKLLKDHAGPIDLGEGRRTRTFNQRIKSPLLYQLSYAPVGIAFSFQGAA